MHLRSLKKNMEFTTSQLAALFFVCLYSMDFIGRYYYWVFIAFILLLCGTRKVTLGAPFAFLFGLSLSLLIFGSYENSLITTFLKPLVYPICFFMGCNFFNNGKNKFGNEKNISGIIFVIALGLLVHFLLNFVTNIGNDERNTIDFWYKQVLSATGQTALACIPIAIACAWLVSECGKVKKIIAVLSILLILAYNLILGGRTIIVVLIVCLVLTLVHLIISGKFVNRKKIITIVLLICAIIALLIIFNVFGLRDAILNSNLYDRFFGEYSQELGDDSRGDRKQIYLTRFFESFWGGTKIRQDVGYAHDLYLDTFDYAGIFSLVFVILYIISSLFRIIKVLKQKKFSFKFKQLMFCFYLVANIEFFIEPILFGMPWFFAAYCLVDGLVYSYLKKENITIL